MIDGPLTDEELAELARCRCAYPLIPRQVLLFVRDNERLRAERLDKIRKATDAENRCSILHGVIERRDLAIGDLERRNDRIQRENTMLRAEISESHTHGEPCESVYFVLRCDDGVEYPATACSQCHRWEQCGRPGEPCLDADCAGLLELDE